MYLVESQLAKIPHVPEFKTSVDGATSRSIWLGASTTSTSESGAGNVGGGVGEGGEWEKATNANDKLLKIKKKQNYTIVLFMRSERAREIEALGWGRCSQTRND